MVRRTAYVRSTVVIATYVVIHRCVLRVWEGGDVFLVRKQSFPIDPIYTNILNLEIIFLIKSSLSTKVYTNMLGSPGGGSYIYYVNEKR